MLYHNVMKIKRYKKAERYMSLYKNNFGFREPYQVLLDGTFCQVALVNKVNLQEQMPKYLSGQCKLLTTACVIDETKRLGKPLQGSYQILSQFPVHNCGHEKPISASKCLSSFVIDSRNKDHYLVATQDYNLRNKIAKFAVCPLLKLANNALVMEKPTHKVQSKVDRTHHFLANKISDEEKMKADEMKKEEDLYKGLIEIKKRKRKGPKGPNPLSCKKKQKKIAPKKDKPQNGDSPEKKRTRKKVRVPRHVKKILQETLIKEPNKGNEKKDPTTSNA